MENQKIQELKIGDMVKCVYNDNGTDEYVGCSGKIVGIDVFDSYPYTVDFAYSGKFSRNELELIETIQYSNGTPLSIQIYPYIHINQIEEDLKAITKKQND